MSISILLLRKICKNCHQPIEFDIKMNAWYHSVRGDLRCKDEFNNTLENLVPQAKASDRQEIGRRMHDWKYAVPHRVTKLQFISMPS